MERGNRNRGRRLSGGREFEGSNLSDREGVSSGAVKGWQRDYLKCKGNVVVRLKLQPI